MIDLFVVIAITLSLECLSIANAESYKEIVNASDIYGVNDSCYSVNNVIRLVSEKKTFPFLKCFKQSNHSIVCVFT